MRKISLRAPLAGRVCLPRMRRRPRLGSEDQTIHLSMCRLRSADLGDRRHHHACQQAAADRLVLGGLSDGHTLQRHFGSATAEPAGLGSYRTAWMLCAKLRRSMVDPDRQPLRGIVEADETIIPFRTKNDPIVVPAGRSGVGKMLVAGAVEVDGGIPRRARLKVIESFGKTEIHAFVLGAVAPTTKHVTDDWPSYQNILQIRHRAITVGPMAAHIVLPWTHRLFSNLKRWGLGVYHGLRRVNLQHYLDEFVFRFNRRRTRHAAFDTLLRIGTRAAPTPYHVLIRKAA